MGRKQWRADRKTRFLWRRKIVWLYQLSRHVSTKASDKITWTLPLVLDSSHWPRRNNPKATTQPAQWRGLHCQYLHERRALNKLHVPTRRQLWFKKQLQCGQSPFQQVLWFLTSPERAKLSSPCRTTDSCPSKCQNMNRSHAQWRATIYRLTASSNEPSQWVIIINTDEQQTTKSRIACHLLHEPSFFRAT